MLLYAIYSPLHSIAVYIISIYHGIKKTNADTYRPLKEECLT
jgi:hypothetical protein